MKRLLVSVSILFLVSCSQFGTRNPASVSEAFSVGDVKSSMLAPQEFQEQNGNVWVLMDGQDVSGSEYELITSSSTVPDARGRFLRMSNNGIKCEDKNNCQHNPDAKSLGEYQEDTLQDHNHYGRWGSQGNGWGSSDRASGREANSRQTDAATFVAHVRNARVSSETRPKNITVNFYIKIDSCSNSNTKCR